MVEGELALALFGCVCLLLLFGFPVALTLAGTALLFAAIGVIAGHFDASFVAALSGRMFGTITNETLVAVPLFILMGVTLERAKIAEELLTAMASGLGNRTGGLGISVIVVGALLAASTGIVGATVVTMGVLALPSMLRAGYNPSLATGLICATGTLGQIIPPSIALVLLGDIMSTGLVYRFAGTWPGTRWSVPWVSTVRCLAKPIRLPSPRGDKRSRPVLYTRRRITPTAINWRGPGLDYCRRCNANRSRRRWCGRCTLPGRLQISARFRNAKRHRALSHGNYEHGVLDPHWRSPVFLGIQGFWG